MQPVIPSDARENMESQILSLGYEHKAALRRHVEAVQSCNNVAQYMNFKWHVWLEVTRWTSTYLERSE